MFDEIQSDLKHIVAKYKNSHSSEEILQTLSRIIDLEVATSLLHVRMDQNIYEIFEKDDFELIGLGRLLKDISRVVYIHRAKTCLQYYNEAAIEFSTSNLFNDTSEAVVVVDKATYTNNMKHIRKRKLKDLKENHLVQKSKDHLPSLFKLKYIFNEHTIDNTISTNNRPSSVSVMQNPTKSINLTIYSYHGVASLDEEVVIDFQMLTASFSPSNERILIDQMSNNNNNNDGNNDNISCSNDGSSCIEADYDRNDTLVTNNTNDYNHISNSSKATTEAVDKADYYNVNVNMDAISKLSKWLMLSSPTSVCHNSSVTNSNNDVENSSTTTSSYYDNHPEWKDTLMFLLSLPYVDEAWGIHDLILDHELGLEDDTTHNSCCTEANSNIE